MIPGPGIYYDVNFADYVNWQALNHSTLKHGLRSMAHIRAAIEHPIVATPAMLLPEFQHRVYSAFMASRLVRLASPEVVDALQDYGEFLLESMRLTLPQAVPNPDDVALIRQVDAQRAQLAAEQEQAAQAKLPAGQGV